MSNNSSAILFLTSWYPVNKNPVHGIFIKNHALALSLYAPVVVVYAYSSYEGPFYQVEEKRVNDNLLELRIKYSKPSFSFPLWRIISQTLKFRKAYKILLSHLIRKNISIKAIQVNIVFPASVALEIFKTHYKVKHTIVENWSGYLEADGNYKGMGMKHFTKKCFSEADKIWHVSEPLKQALIKHGLTGNFELIFNTVNIEVFKPGIEKNDRRDQAGKIKFLHVSSLVEREKNISGTFRVIKKLQDKHYSFEFTIIGGNNETISSAKQMANQLQLNINFLGAMPPEKVSEQMQQSHDLILFSYFEGMPVVVLEALSCGLPVLATGVGHLPYLVNEEFGKLVDVANEEQMFTVLENFILNKYKFNREAMHRFILKHASLEAVGKQFFGYYKPFL
jgi:glycosyltransferase involved in cell wall biosynthesis